MEFIVGPHCSVRAAVDLPTIVVIFVLVKGFLVNPTLLSSLLVPLTRYVQVRWESYRFPLLYIVYKANPLSPSLTCAYKISMHRKAHMQGESR